MPNAAVFGVLADPASPQSVVADLRAAARKFGLQLVVVNARTDSDLETAFATFSQQGVGGVLGLTAVAPHTEQLAALAARHASPASPSKSTFICIEAELHIKVRPSGPAASKYRSMAR